MSSPGNFVLSVVMDGEPQHILIHRHAHDDAVFSLGMEMIHVIHRHAHDAVFSLGREIHQLPHVVICSCCLCY